MDSKNENFDDIQCYKYGTERCSSQDQCVVSRMGKFLHEYSEQQEANTNQLIPDDLSGLQNSLPLGPEELMDDHAYPEGEEQGFKEVDFVYTNSISKKQCGVLLNDLKKLTKRVKKEIDGRKLAVNNQLSAGQINEEAVASFVLSAGRARFLKQAYDSLVYSEFDKKG